MHIPGLFGDFKEQRGVKQREFAILKRVSVQVSGSTEESKRVCTCFSVGGNEYSSFISR